MGFNISGLVIDKNYENKILELQQILDYELTFDKEVNFEEASENWKSDKYCDIYFSEKGTLIFLSFEKSGFEFPVLNQTTLAFVLSEMSMTFSINYTENQKLLRTIVETEESIHVDEGNPFPFEENESDKSELIYHLFEKTLGKSFWDIDLDEKCYRYYFKEFHNPFKSQDESVELVSSKSLNESNIQAKKAWWRFW